MARDLILNKKSQIIYKNLAVGPLFFLCNFWLSNGQIVTDHCINWYDFYYTAKKIQGQKKYISFQDMYLYVNLTINRKSICN